MNQKTTNKYLKLREEPLKSKIREDYFCLYRYTQLGNIDFVIAKYNTKHGGRNLLEDDSDFEKEYTKSILWAEAKQGTHHDIYESFVQLILTIGKERTFEKYLPPKYIGAFDAEKFAFIEYHTIQKVFYQNDFDWTVTPSNHETSEFKQLYELCKKNLQDNAILFYYETQSEELESFIRTNFKTDAEITEKIAVTKNNFTYVFQRWSEIVKPTIAIDWEVAAKNHIIPADFFLAGLISKDGKSLKESLFVVLNNDKYELARKIDEMGLFTSSKVPFTDKQKAYKEFWSIYERPPKEEYWDYIIGRRDLLVPQDVRERKGSFFTPKIWVEKSQEYLAQTLGENWQEEYTIWDCCAGTGNLLNGLTNYDNVWASTLDKQDVDVMVDRIHNGWNMAENHVFQFDFLNDDFTKCPEELQEILKSEEKRKKLVIYINPPYAEAGTMTTISGTGSNKAGVAIENKTYEKYKNEIGKASNELFAQFFIRIYKELQCCKLAQFATLKALCASNFAGFREVFQAKLEKMFVVPAVTFDNVQGKFPIGFVIWNTNKKEKFEKTISDVFNAKGDIIGSKVISASDGIFRINDWLRKYFDKKNNDLIGIMHNNKNDFQHNGQVCITTTDNKDHTTPITQNNLIPFSIYFSVRHCIEATWLNDRDQFLFPNDGYKTDIEFQTNCLMYTLFHGQNRISSTQGTNHWIPFTREQVGCTKTFKSNFMSDFIAGKIKTENSHSNELFENKIQSFTPQKPIEFSKEALDVYNAGLELYKYYHKQPRANPDASFYDIRKFFQGETKGRMNNTSEDEFYNQLIANLRAKMKLLAKTIEPKVYEYGFLL